jgi:GT2 family glycosyltransferase
VAARRRDGRVAIVIATRNRRESLLRTIARLAELPERPAVIVVDNASSDGTAAAVAPSGGASRVVALGRNLGAGARTIGARASDAPYIAFSDDDSWWAPGALRRAADLLDAHPRLGLIAARVLVGEELREDPVCRLMADSPLPAGDGGPGVPVLGFVACGAVVRRAAFLEAGGFEPRLGVGGEEELLAIDMADAGWRLAYHSDVVAHHHPAPRDDDGAARRRVQARNALWCAWLRRPAPRAAAITGRTAVAALRDPVTRAGAAEAIARGAWVARRRRVVGAGTERALRALELA